MTSRLMQFLAVLVAVGVLGLVGGAAGAQTQMKPIQKKVAKAAVKKAAAMYECQHCKHPMSLAAAKKMGMKCCGMKMVEVKTAKKVTPKKKA